MRTVEIKEGAIDGILEDLLKRSPNNYTEYESTVKTGYNPSKLKNDGIKVDSF